MVNELDICWNTLYLFTFCVPYLGTVYLQSFIHRNFKLDTNWKEHLRTWRGRSVREQVFGAAIYWLLWCTDQSADGYLYSGYAAFQGGFNKTCCECNGHWWPRKNFDGRKIHPWTKADVWKATGASYFQIAEWMCSVCCDEWPGVYQSQQTQYIQHQKMVWLNVGLHIISMFGERERENMNRCTSLTSV